MKAQYKVSGMTCDGCANAVIRAITARVPEARVLVDLDTGTISVEGLDEEQAVGAAVEDAGFEFGGRI